MQRKLPRLLANACLVSVDLGEAREDRNQHLLGSWPPVTVSQTTHQDAELDGQVCIRRDLLPNTSLAGSWQAVANIVETDVLSAVRHGMPLVKSRAKCGMFVSDHLLGVAPDEPGEIQMVPISCSGADSRLNSKQC